MTDKILDNKVIAAQRQVKSAAHISEPYGGTQVLQCFMLPLCMSVSVKPPFVASGTSVYLVFCAQSISKQLIIKSLVLFPIHVPLTLDPIPNPVS